MKTRSFEVYCDDIAVFSEDDAAKHEEALRELLDRCRVHGIRLNNKSVLFEREIIFLGRRVAYNKIEAIVDKQSIQQFPTPRTQSAMRRYRHLIQHHRVEVLTDCLPLVHALNGQDPPTDARWERVLAELLLFDFKLVHVKGSTHTVADALSRPSLQDSKDPALEITAWRPTGNGFSSVGIAAVATPNASEWSHHYDADEYTAAIMASLRTKDANSDYLSRKYSLRNGLLYLTDPLHRVRLVVPQGRVQEALSHFHDSDTAGHPARTGHCGLCPVSSSSRKWQESSRDTWHSAQSAPCTSQHAKPQRPCNRSRYLQGRWRTSQSTSSVVSRRST